MDANVLETFVLKTFVCHECGETKPVQKFGGTGYCWDAENHKICYACCGKQDTKRMEAGERMCLYLSGSVKEGGIGMNRRTIIHDRRRGETYGAEQWYITNWPSTINIPVGVVNIGDHNIARVRYDVWFQYAGHNWHGVQYGDNTQIVHCRAVK